MNSAKGAAVPVVITYDPGGRDPNEKIGVSPDPFQVSKGDCEQVKWVCVYKESGTQGPPFTVDFKGENGSPFYETQFSDEVPYSGLVRRDVLPFPDKIYEYTVRIEATERDPGGGVKA